MRQTGDDEGLGQGELLERADELEVITTAIAAAASGAGGMVVIEGPAGIGKTVLLDAAAGAASAAGLRGLVARGGELERDFGFGVARQLLEPVLQGDSAAKDLLAGPAAPAAALLSASPAPTEEAAPASPDAVLAAVHSLYWLVANLAARVPIAILVDDAHWADTASLRLISYLGRRVESLPVLLVVARRPPPDPGGDRVAAALTHWPDATVLQPRPLSRRGAGRLVRELVAGAGDELCARCHTATGGNPFFLRELARAVADRDGDPDPELLPLDAEHIVHAVLARVDQGSPEAAALARVVAVLGQDLPLRHAASIAGLAPAVASEAADALAAAGIFAARRPLDFRHPIIRIAVAGTVPLGARAAAHARAARLLAGEGASPERIAVHLLATEPGGEAWLCEHLVGAARNAVGRGAPEAAVEYLRRTLEEPPPADTRAIVLLELGAAEVLALQPEAAVHHLRSGLATTPDTEPRLRYAMLLGGVLGLASRTVEAVEAIAAALDTAPNADPELVAQGEAQLLNVSRMSVAARRLVRPRALALVRRAESGAELPAPLLAAAAAELVIAGRSAVRAAALAERSLIEARGLPDILDYSLYTAARTLVSADRPMLARPALDAVIDRARTRSGPDLTGLLTFRALDGYGTGDLAGVEADAREALEGSSGQGWPSVLPAAVAALLLVLVERAEHTEAQALLGRHGMDGPPGELPDLYPAHLLLHARGLLRMACGEKRTAVDDLLECGRREREFGELNPAVIEWGPPAAIGLALLGERREAGELIADQLERARAFGARRTIGVVLRAAGLIEEGEAALTLLGQAVEVLAGSPARLERARALVDYGAAVRRSGRRVDARPALRSGLDLAHSCGATALERRALDELHAAGARPRRAILAGPGALTLSERRVTELAATGASNHEVADALFLSVRTVEYHLGAAYRKLEIDSRHGLGAALAGGEDATPSPALTAWRS